MLINLLNQLYVIETYFIFHKRFGMAEDAAGARRGHHNWEQLHKANQNVTLQRAGAQRGLSPQLSVITEPEHFSPDNIYQTRYISPKTHAVVSWRRQRAKQFKAWAGSCLTQPVQVTVFCQGPQIRCKSPDITYCPKCQETVQSPCSSPGYSPRAPGQQQFLLSPLCRSRICSRVKSPHQGML